VERIPFHSHVNTNRYAEPSFGFFCGYTKELRKYIL
jgi:hypothetical protein